MIKAAVVGLGWWGRNIVKALRDSEGIRITHGFDPGAEGLATFASEQGVELVDSFASLLEDPAVDAVVVATPHSLHEPQALAALTAGKPVFCEKPLALNARGARRILEVSEQKGFPLGVGHERRFEPAMEEALAILSGGRQGQLLHMEANVSHNVLAGLNAANWRHNSIDAPAAAMTALGVHLSDLFISFAGRPTRVRARTAKKTEMPGQKILLEMFKVSKPCGGPQGLGMKNAKLAVRAWFKPSNVRVTLAPPRQYAVGNALRGVPGPAERDRARSLQNSAAGVLPCFEPCHVKGRAKPRCLVV